MDPHKHLKLIGLLIVASLLITFILLMTSNPSVAVYTAMLADAIQIATYLVGLWQKEVPLENIQENIEDINQYIQQEKERYQAREEIISRLINEGVILENELYNLIRNKEVILVFPYGKAIPRRIRGREYKQAPHILLLEKIGFVRVTRKQNLMVAFTDRLPQTLREVENINVFIKQELPRLWKQISEKAKREFPPDQYQIYEKWRDGKGFGITYIISKSMAQDFAIDYINRESFTSEFKKHILGAINWNELKKTIRKRRQQVKEVISKIAIDILLRSLPRHVKEKIIEHEDEIKNILNIKVFTDYAFIEEPRLKEVLLKFLSESEKGNIDRYSSLIISEGKKYYESLTSLGITM